MSTIQPADGGTKRVTAKAPFVGAALGVATFVAYLPGLGRSLDFDSAETLGQFIRPGPPWAAFRDQVVFNNHPMFSFLEQVVRVTTGRADAATMRLLPILCGALAVGVLAWFTTRRHGPVAGVAAGALLACNPTFVDLSRAVRGYSLLTLCALVATIVLVSDHHPPWRWSGPLYVAAAGVGLATHLYMLPVLAAHVGLILATRKGGPWLRRVVWATVLGSCAYALMAAAMLDAAGRHARVFKADMPWRVATMAAGGSWAAIVVLPLVVAGALLVLRGSRAARGAALGLAAALLGLWAVMQSSALDERFFVWLAPGAAYLAGVAIGRLPAAAVLAAGSAALALATVVPGYSADPTAYRVAADLLRAVDAAGLRACVVGIGVRPMQGYLSSPDDFAAISHSAGLDACDVVAVTTWWPTTADWFAADRRIINAAEARFPHRVVLDRGDPTLVLSTRPLADRIAHVAVPLRRYSS